MFRSTKKKKPALRKVVRKSVDDDGDDGNNENDKRGQAIKAQDDDDDDENGDDAAPSLTMALQQRKKKLSKKGKSKSIKSGLVVRSFDMDGEEDGNDNDTSKKKKKKKRKRGLGFGGSGALDDAERGDENTMDVDDDAENATSYGKEELEKLKAEQKKRKKLKVETSDEQNQSSLSNIATQSALPTTIRPSTEESFISVNVNTPADREVILNADSDTNLERMEHLMEEAAADPEEAAMWNEQIERRAGIQSSSSAAKPSMSKLVSLDKLSQNIQSTIQTIQTQQEELQNTINRRKADREHALVDKKTQQETVHTAGEACEYYQKLRHDLTLWVGALRDLRQKVDPIQQAFQEMLEAQCEDADHEFQSLQDDCIAVMEEQGIVKQVLGRQPKTPTNTGAASIDEFGRDVRSQYLRDRDVRFQTRQKKYDASEESPFANKIVAAFYEDHNEKERCDTLHEALQAALQDLDQDYTSLDGLKNIFNEWKSTYPEDYKQCYASLSLGDLLTVFLQTELCKSTWFSTILSTENGQDGSNDDSFPKKMEALLQGEANDIVDDECRGRAIEKSILPFLKATLQTYPAGNYFLLQSKSEIMSTLVNECMKYLQPLSKHQLVKAISDAIAKTLDAIAIPILNKETTDEAKNDAVGANEELAIRFARWYLVKILQGLLCNMILHWFPLLPLETEGDGTDGIQAVLTFINEKFLMLLSSTDTDESKQSFRAIWETLRKDPRNILESPSLLLMTMPLRAAGTAYGLA